MDPIHPGEILMMPPPMTTGAPPVGPLIVVFRVLLSKVMFISPEASASEAAWLWSPLLSVNVLPVTPTFMAAPPVLRIRRPSSPVTVLVDANVDSVSALVRSAPSARHQ
jgi:hypothetical protein